MQCQGVKTLIKLNTIWQQAYTLSALPLRRMAGRPSGRTLYFALLKKQTLFRGLESLFCCWAPGGRARCGCCWLCHCRLGTGRLPSVLRCHISQPLQGMLLLLLLPLCLPLLHRLLRRPALHWLGLQEGPAVAWLYCAPATGGWLLS